MSVFRVWVVIVLVLCTARVNAQELVVSGTITTKKGSPLAGANVCLKTPDHCTASDGSGAYRLVVPAAGKYMLVVTLAGYERTEREVTVTTHKGAVADISLTAHISVLDSVVVRSSQQTLGITQLKDVDGAGIYAGKKSEVIVLKDITANTATNNPRQVYAKVAGLNIWENDGAGIQLAVGGRGLNPNRTSNFNTRQNGYDISADALGYPESYYTPPTEALDRIEVVRGAASLQYGTQFGGIINFKLNSGPEDKKLELVSRETGGSWGFFNTSNSIGGTIKKLNYYAFFQHKSGNGWRDDSRFNVNTGYLALTYQCTSKLSLSVQYTHMDYLERQPGGLSDQMFAADPRQSTKERNWFKVNWNLGAVLLDYSITQHLKFNTRFFGLSASRYALGIINTVTDPGGPRQYRSDDYSNWGNESRFVFSWNAKHAQPYTLLAGMRYYQGFTDRKIGNANDGSGGAKSDFAFSEATLVDSLSYSAYQFPNHNLSFFAENIFRIGKKLSVIPGIRYERIVTKATGYYNSFQQDRAGNVIYSELVNEDRSSDRSFVIGGIGLSYNQSGTCQLYANFSQNYRSINFNDMSIVNPNYRVDPKLGDETGYSADLGARGHYSNLLSYDISLFAINYDNRIGSILAKDTSSPNVYRLTTNVSRSRNLGVESFIELDFWKLIHPGSSTKLSFFSNFSWITARYVHSKEAAYENKRVEFVPDVIWKTGLAFRRNRFSATYQYAYTGSQFTDATNSETPTNNGINGLVPAYFVMDLSADYRISRIFSVSASVNNLTDNRYYTRRADTYPGPGIIPADGQSLYLTLQVKL